MRDRMKEREKDPVRYTLHTTSSCKPHGPVEPHSKAAPWMWPTMALEAAGGRRKKKRKMKKKEKKRLRGRPGKWKREREKERKTEKERERSGITR